MSMFDLARMAAFGPLSHKGFVLRGASRYKQEQANRIVADSLLNPESIRELAELSKLNPTSFKAGIIAGSLAVGGDDQ